MRERLLAPGSADSTSCVMNHSGNWKQSMPVGGGGRVLLFGRGRKETERWHSKHLGQFVSEARLDNLLAALRPMIETGDEHGVIGQVQHGPGAKGHDDLALAHFAVWLGSRFAAHASSSSTSVPSSVFIQRFTLGSTSRMERLARNFILGWCAGRCFNSGLRNS